MAAKKIFLSENPDRGTGPFTAWLRVCGQEIPRLRAEFLKKMVDAGRTRTYTSAPKCARRHNFPIVTAYLTAVVLHYRITVMVAFDRDER